MNAILFDSNSRKVVKVVRDVTDITNKVVYARKMTLDFSREEGIECILTNNEFSVGQVLPENTTEPPTAEERLEALELAMLEVVLGGAE